jgi:hypothetical protein
MENIQQITFMGKMLATVIVKGLSQQQVLAGDLMWVHVRTKAISLLLLCLFS